MRRLSGFSHALTSDRSPKTPSRPGVSIKLTAAQGKGEFNTCAEELLTSLCRADPSSGCLGPNGAGKSTFINILGGLVS
jgi:ABC-type transport system involved in cytochrome bd biosynthesis fused ATPase/permease subunit